MYHDYSRAGSKRRAEKEVAQRSHLSGKNLEIVYGFRD